MQRTYRADDGNEDSRENKGHKEAPPRQTAFRGVTSRQCHANGTDKETHVPVPLSPRVSSYQVRATERLGVPGPLCISSSSGSGDHQSLLSGASLSVCPRPDILQLDALWTP
jgi:hypothetical protein